MKKVNALILTGFGLNCDNETAHLFELAGAKAHKIHINTMISGKVKLDDFQILALGGGFSWGDDHGGGVIHALKMKNHIGKDLLNFVEQGKLIIGICNGFQALVNLGLLPGIDNDYSKRSVSITYNDCGNFMDKWVHLAVNKKSPCVFTKDIDIADFPIRHGEGKFIADEKIIDTLIANNQIVLQYADKRGLPAKGSFPLNPNGSIKDIAGICDPTGRIFGLMPHPEAYNHYTNHPDWTRNVQLLKRQGETAGKTMGEICDQEITIGVKLFKNGIDYIKSLKTKF